MADIRENLPEQLYIVETNDGTNDWRLVAELIGKDPVPKEQAQKIFNSAREFGARMGWSSSKFRMVAIQKVIKP